MDWLAADEKLVSRMVEQGAAYLSGQVRLATAADQRASMLAGVFAAAGTVILAGIITLATSADFDIGRAYPLVLAAIGMVACFLAGAALCIWTIVPVGIWLPGNEPQSWYGDIESKKVLLAALGEEAEHIQSKIVENRSIIRANAGRFRWGAILGIVAPIVGAVLWVISSLFSWACL